jgi:predicted metal-dependent hydrolase
MHVLQLGSIAIDVVLKDIKNVHLSVHPPSGRVRVAAPRRMSLDTIRVFAIAKLDWIRRQQKAMCDQQREPPRECLDRESHFLWGRRFLLEVVEHDGAPFIDLRHSKMRLHIRPHSAADRRREVVEAWCREQVRRAAVDLIAEWEPRLGARAARLHIQRMRTRWGSCNPVRQSIRLNTELAKKPRECLEYIVVHELIHLLEPTHNARFVALMDRFMPHWRLTRQALNSLPVRHETWEY